MRRKSENKQSLNLKSLNWVFLYYVNFIEKFISLVTKHFLVFFFILDLSELT